MRKPILLDTFCKAGGCTKGYQRAGFYVVGVDIEPQPHYCGDEFIQADALDYLATADLSRYAAIHASPPCQAYSTFTPLSHRANHPDLIDLVRMQLWATGKPYVIENVSGARMLLDNPVMLCGSMFGLTFWRHRYFEIYPPQLHLLPPCQHNFKPVLITDHGGPNGNGKGKPRTRTPIDVKRAAAGIDWMTEMELSEAIPPAYTEWIGQHLMEAIEVCHA
jgi:DNA (cytosine-5)-methyltransferase 1